LSAKPSDLEIFLLGPPRLRYHGVPFGFRGNQRTLSLLVYLLLHRRQPVLRDVLAQTLWPDVPTDQGRARVRGVLYALATLGLPERPPVPWVLADRRSLQWNARAPCWIDLDEFDRLSAGGDDELIDAVALFGGDLAEGLDDEWLVPLRERTRERQTTVLLRLIERARAAGDPSEGIRYAQQLLRLDPFREDAARALMELRFESGDRAGALQSYRTFAERLDKELGVDPMPETTSAYDRIAAAQLRAIDPRPIASTAALHVRPLHNLPFSLTTFLGREREVDVLAALVAERRLVTITGTGGVGKTRLATHTGRRVVEHFRDGVWLVELADLTDPQLVAETAAMTLGMEDRSSRPSFAALYARQCLMIFDNCEHVLDAAGTTVRRILTECPEMRILATSREPLCIPGERVVFLDPLPYPKAGSYGPPPVEQIRDSPAVRLFLERAAEASPNFRGPEREDDWHALVTITRRLSGIPLAIELAAARTNVLPIERIAQSLDDRFSLLTRGSRTHLPRHQTLEACFDWSYALLNETEQRNFCRFSVFAGGFTLEAAAYLCPECDEAETLSLLQSLVDKSLVCADVRGAEPRYTLLESVRAYALQKLTAREEAPVVLHRHAEYFADISERFNGAYSKTISAQKPDEDERVDVSTLLRALTRELDNLRAAMEWTVIGRHDTELGVRIVGELWRFFIARSLYAEGERWADAALAALQRDGSLGYEGSVQLLRAMTRSFPYFMPQYQRDDGHGAVDDARRAVALLRPGGDPQQAVMACGILVVSLCIEGRIAEAAGVAADALAIARASRDPLHLGIALYFQTFTIGSSDCAARLTMLEQALDAYDEAQFAYGIGYTMLALAETHAEARDLASALRCAYEAQEYYRQIGDWSTLTIVRANVAKYLVELGDLDAARAAGADALRLAEDTGDSAAIALALQPLAAIAASSPEPATGARLLAAADTLFQRTERHRVLFALTEYERIQRKLAARLTEAERRRAIVEGQSWRLPRAIAEARAI
jgi:predicted ATPase/DNA-binding SARP family transcriptional activator